MVKIVTIYHFAITIQKINKKVIKIAKQKINKKVMKKNIGRQVHHIMINQVLEKIINQVIKNIKIA